MYPMRYLALRLHPPGSPGLAICTCAYMEHEWTQAITDFARFNHIRQPDRLFRFTRYVDDVFGVVAYDAREPLSLEFARFVVASLADNAYDPSLILKEEPHSGWFAFLDALLHLPAGGPFSMRFHNKNFTTLTTTGQLKQLTIQDRSSFMSRSQAVQKVAGALHRLRRTVSTDVCKTIGVIEMAVCFSAQGYSMAEFADALRKVEAKTGDKFLVRLVPVVLALRL